MSGEEENLMKNVLESLKLQKYYVNFQKEEILYSDLEYFSEADLREFIPSKFHLKRLLVYMNKEKEKKKLVVENISRKSDAETVGKEVENVYDVPLNSTDDELEKIIPERDQRKRLIKFLESTKEEKKKKRKIKVGSQSECEKTKEEGLVQMKIKFGNDVKIFYEIPLGTNEELIGKLVQEFLECELKLPDKTILRKDRKFNLERWLKRAGMSPGDEIRGVLSVKDFKSSYSSEDSVERVIELERKLEMVEKERDRKDTEVKKLKKENLALLEKLKGLDSRSPRKGVASRDLEFESGVGKKEKLKKEKQALFGEKEKLEKEKRSRSGLEVKGLVSRGVASPEMEFEKSVVGEEEKQKKEKPALLEQEVMGLESRRGISSPDLEFESVVGEKEKLKKKKHALLEEKGLVSRGVASPEMEFGSGVVEEEKLKETPALFGEKEKLEKEKRSPSGQELKGPECRRGVASPDQEFGNMVGELEKCQLEKMLETAHNSLWGLNELRIDHCKARKLYSEIVNSGGELDANANFNLGQMYAYGYGVKKDNEKFDEFHEKAADIYMSTKFEEVKQWKPVDLKNMGLMYVTGKGVKQNEKWGIKMLEKSVECGNVLAMRCLGLFYQMGTFVSKSNSEALKLYAKAAEFGLPSAIWSLGFMNANGHGVNIDRKLGFRLYLVAAEKGQREAMFNVASCYRHARGVEKNAEEAKKWLKMASDLGHEEAKTILEGLNTKEKRRLEMLEAAHNCLWGLNNVRIDYYKPHKLYGEIVNSGGKLDANAHFNLGEMYENGYGVKFDAAKSGEFYKKAAEFYSSKQVDDLKPRDWTTVGYMYVHAKGFEDNDAMGIESLKRAVAGGNSLAMSRLGECYECGWGVAKSASEAFKLYTKAVELRLPVAMNNLGSLYYNGLGVKKDEKKAFALYREAAEKGERDAMLKVSEFYMDGVGVKTNIEEAKKWYKMTQGLRNRETKRGKTSMERRLYEREDTAHNCLWGLNGMTINCPKAYKLFKEIENSGGKLDANANFNLGEMYWHGSGVKKNKATSKEYYKKAAEFYSSKKVGDMESIDLKNLGYMYVLGRGLKENEKWGVELLKKAVKRGNVLAMRRLGWCYQKGYGVAKSYRESVKLYSKAADLGLPAAMNNLGIMYLKGFGVKKDRKKAFGLFYAATEKGNRTAIFNLGRCYLNGWGVAVDDGEAERWLEIASNWGHEEARELFRRVLHEPRKRTYW